MRLLRLATLLAIGATALAVLAAAPSGGGLTGAVQVADGAWVYQMTESGLAAELTPPLPRQSAAVSEELP
ncbi:hypothetical protein D3C87_580830 [compost metagenome]